MKKSRNFIERRGLENLDGATIWIGMIYFVFMIYFHRNYGIGAHDDYFIKFEEWRLFAHT